MSRGEEVYKSRTTAYVIASWVLAAFGGLMFGYDIGISGLFFSSFVLFDYRENTKENHIENKKIRGLVWILIF
ncbi:unnamed protein product [Thlaspi arvense]|uniref:Uncharacterized protein n=1 Tax=Thlaspi arvense TaxID=13288 RepID=A0AAU9S291_THLAR|nr:unnamed protein product [Thlaspi arvense]